jgi:hypothetical protein
MNRHRGGIFALIEEECERLLALGREGLRFSDIGRDLGISASTAHAYWQRCSADHDRSARDVILAALGGVRASQVDVKDQREIGPGFTNCTFTDDPRAAASGRLGRVNGAEPFGFSLYGGTFR